MADVLVMCHGNYMRSPACEAVLKVEGISVESAGFKPRASKAAKKMREAMAARGFNLDAHEPREITDAMVHPARLILLMDSGNAERFNRRYLDAPTRMKVRCLGHYIGLGRIQDPAFQKEPRFSAIVDEIIAASKAFAAEWRKQS